MKRQSNDRTTADGATAQAGPAGRDAPLAMDAHAFRAAGHRLVDRIAEHLESLPTRPVVREGTPASIRAAFDLESDLPDAGVAPGPLLERTAELLFEHSLFNAHPLFFGFVTASPAPIGILGDFLAAAINPNVGAWVLSPAATEIERQTVRWIAQLIGYPTACGGLLVSGGNMANLVCFFAARAAKASPERDVPGGGRAAGALRVYGSAETHTWIQKAAGLGGLGADAVRWIPTDAELRMDVAVLRDRIEVDRAAGERPFLVVGTAGTVGTGAVDPLREIAALCREHDLWFHVDGAYGGFAAALPDASDDLRALAVADSVAVDPHKWLYAPLEAGCALVKDADTLRNAFAHSPPYYDFDERVLNYVDYGVQNSRGFRALKVWLALRQAGAAGYRAMISDDMRLSLMLGEQVEKHRELERMTQALSITTFRFVPADLRARRAEATVGDYLDTLNRALLHRLQREGEVFLSNAVLGGRYVLRACIVNFHTGPADIQRVPEIVARVGRELDGTMRPKGLEPR